MGRASGSQLDRTPAQPFPQAQRGGVTCPGSHSMPGKPQHQHLAEPITPPSCLDVGDWDGGTTPSANGYGPRTRHLAPHFLHQAGTTGAVPVAEQATDEVPRAPGQAQVHSSWVAEAAFLLTCLEALASAQPLPSMVPHLVFLPRILFPFTWYSWSLPTTANGIISWVRGRRHRSLVRAKAGPLPGPLAGAALSRAPSPETLWPERAACGPSGSDPSKPR